MITRPLVLTMVCFGLFLLIQSLMPKALAMKKTSNMDEFMLDDQQTRRRKNYVLQMARNSDALGNMDNIGPEYNTETLESDTNPEDLQALMVDYANMIRNDVILLDNSVETRTRKRGNFKVEKKYNQAIPDPPCGCDYVKDSIELGVHYVPRSVETKNCSKATQQMCKSPYICMENMYNITVLRKKDRSQQESPELPAELRRRWITEIIPISVGCTCSSEYMFRIDNLPTK